MAAFNDGPQTSLFHPLPLKTGTSLSDLAAIELSPEMGGALNEAPEGEGVAWAIPFEVSEVVIVEDQVVSVALAAIRSSWLVFMHTTDLGTYFDGDLLNAFFQNVVARGAPQPTPLVEEPAPVP